MAGKSLLCSQLTSIMIRYLLRKMTMTSKLKSSTIRLQMKSNFKVSPNNSKRRKCLLNNSNSMTLAQALQVVSQKRKKRRGCLSSKQSKDSSTCGCLAHSRHSILKIALPKLLTLSNCMFKTPLQASSKVPRVIVGSISCLHHKHCMQMPLLMLLSKCKFMPRSFIWIRTAIRSRMVSTRSH